MQRVGIIRGAGNNLKGSKGFTNIFSSQGQRAGMPEVSLDSDAPLCICARGDTLEVVSAGSVTMEETRTLYP